jgi:hypothetical protein
MSHPVLALVFSFPILWLAVRIGAALRTKWRDSIDIDDDDFNLILGATLTLLGLIIGFTFSMGVGRYDQRKNYEEEEANAIGTEYLRANLLPAADAAKVRSVLRSYLDQRILYYTIRDEQQLREVKIRKSQLQDQLWSTVATVATAQPTPVTALILSGMNDVLNSEGYTVAAWRNRIPGAAWLLMGAIAILCNLLIGYGRHGKGGLLLFVLPIALSISFFLIADIDSPRGGLIRVHPQNLESLADSLRPQ